GSLRYTITIMNMSIDIFIINIIFLTVMAAYEEIIFRGFIQSRLNGLIKNNFSYIFYIRL
ncbi:MAG: hypothetical protein RSE45_04250, partial [Bacilli bacterium]